MTIFIAYVIGSLVLGGLAATYEIWHRPGMLDRATGGKHPSPKMNPSELVTLALFVAIAWPLLAVPMIIETVDAWRTKP